MKPLVSTYASEDMLNDVLQGGSQTHTNKNPYHNNACFDYTETDYIQAVLFIERQFLTNLKNKQIAFTGHSTVYRAYSQLYRRDVAIKIINKNAIPHQVVNKFLPRELEITSKVLHPHLCACLGIYTVNLTKVIIVSEYCSGGTLLHLVLNKNGIGETNAARMFRQLIEAVHYLHQRQIAHRDIKLENILLDENADIKLIDFGFARYVADKAERSNSFCGTRPYSAPNIMRSKPYDPFSCDWYAIGVVLYTMLTGNWPCDVIEKEKRNIVGIQFPPNIPSVPARCLIESLLCEDDMKRGAYEECLNSDWLKIQTNNKWVMADRYFVYELHPEKLVH